MDIRKALERKRNGGSSSTRQQNRIHPIDEDDDGVEMLGAGATASDEVDVDWVDQDNFHSGGRTSTPSPEDHMRPNRRLDDDDEPRRGKLRMRLPSPNKPRLGGHVASKYYAEKRAMRERELDKQRVAAATPKNIEKALQEHRARSRRRGKTVSIFPNPVRGVRSFLADPVTRFWLGCNLCCTFTLFATTFIFMVFLYPLLLRPLTMY